MFWLLALMMVVLAGVLIGLPLRRCRPSAELSQDALNAAIFRERLADLEAEYRERRLDEAQYRQLRSELERTLLGDVPADAKPPVRDRPLLVKAAALAVVGVLAAALGYYYTAAYRGEAADWIATRERLDELVTRAMQDPDVLLEQTDLDLVDFTRVLQARLLRQGMTDPNGLYLLGASLLQMQQPGPALFALEQAHQRAPGRPDIMLAYAEALLSAHDGRLAPESAQLLEGVLKANPQHQRALFLLGIGAFNAEDYGRAVNAWQTLLALRDPKSEGAQLIRNSIKRAQALLAARSEAAAAPAQPAAPAGPRLAVTVDLAPALRQRLSPQDTLFIFAKAANGPPMPLAAVRQPVRDFPVQVVLDDSQAMMPAMKLSTFKQVIVNARISKAGAVAAQPGDLQGASGTIELQNGLQSVALMIDQVIAE